MHGFDFEVITRTAPYLFKVGMVFTLKLTLFATMGALVFGTLLAMMRLSSNRIVSLVATGYINLLRSLPLILIIFWLYFLLPYVIGWVSNAGGPVAINGFLSVLITYTLFEAAYFSEIVRAGIQSIPKGQVAAGYALGLSYLQVMRNIVLPQAFRNMIPVLFTQMIIVFQETSLVYVISLTDFFGAASNMAQRDGRVVEMFVFAALVYFVVCYVASRLVVMFERRMAIVR